jgi:hypothetical protein
LSKVSQARLAIKVATKFATKSAEIFALLLLATTLELRAADSPVSAELIVPPAATHVIGDHTPLIWRFRNDSSEPLAFMWEGCCRLNGRLTVTAQDQPIVPVPPGQALAHMFAKAERLEPGKPADFETRLSDWVQLRESGEYQLVGRYTGVLPEQTPQVPRGLNLWRDAATTPAVRVQLSSVAHYLGERSTRAAERGLHLSITGPSRLPPLLPSPLELELHNSSNREQQLAWPHDFQLWIVDATGRRLGNVPTSVEGAYQKLALPPGARLKLSIPFDSGLIEGEPFGDYRVFVDLRQGADGEPRTPSNPLAIRWELGPAEVEQLLQQAAGGSRVGLRNAPLKLLRVYVGELGNALASAHPTGASPALLALRDQLRLASCLKPHAPIPGRVEVPLLIAMDGSANLAGPAAGDCFESPANPPAANDLERLRQLLSVRRHLGWEIGLEVRPVPNITLAKIRTALEPYLEPGLDLAGPPRALWLDGTTNAPLAIALRANPIPAGLLLRVRRENGVVRTAIARKPSTSTTKTQPAQFQPEEIRAAGFREIALDVAGGEWADPRVQTLVLVEPTIEWGELLAALQPLLESRLSFDLLLPPSAR